MGIISEDYCATADDKRYELLNGDLMMVPAPNRKHQWVLGRLHIELGRFTQEHGLGEVYVAPFDVVLSDTDVVQPDLLFIAGTGLERRCSMDCNSSSTISLRVEQSPHAWG